MKILFVYNADINLKSLVDEVAGMISKKAPPCSLCDITYSVVYQKSAWKDYLKKMPIKHEFYYRKSFLKQFQEQLKEQGIPIVFPSVFLLNNNKISLLINDIQLNNLKDVYELIDLMEEKIQIIQG